MKVIINKNTNPHFNLALEEYLLKGCNEDYFMLWQNDNSIIVGRNQNTFAEVNMDYIFSHNIPVVRRLTGGGAVFHDMGNLNYTFIKRDNGDNFGNYEIFARPVIEVLRNIGINAELSGRNDMLIDGKKFSGNAQTSWHGRTLHHGTLMFSSNVSSMTDALNVNPLKIKSKGIKSVRSRVTNINEHLKEPLLIENFCSLISEQIITNGGEKYELNNNDTNAVNKLCNEKYNTNEWNYGYNKKYSFQKESYFSGGLVQIRFNIDCGKITEAKIEGDFFGTHEVFEFENKLIGIKYKPEILNYFLNQNNIQEYFSGISAAELLTAMF